MTHPDLEPRPRNPESRALNIKRPPGALKGKELGVFKSKCFIILLPWVAKREFLLTMSLQHQQKSNANKEKYKLSDYYLNQYQIF